MTMIVQQAAGIHLEICADRVRGEREECGGKGGIGVEGEGEVVQVRGGFAPSSSSEQLEGSAC